MPPTSKPFAMLLVLLVFSVIAIPPRIVS